MNMNMNMNLQSCMCIMNWQSCLLFTMNLHYEFAVLFALYLVAWGQIGCGV